MEVGSIEFVGLALLGLVIHIVAKLKGFILNQKNEPFMPGKWLDKNLMYTAVSVVLVALTAYAYTYSGRPLEPMSAMMMGYMQDSLVKVLGKKYE